MDRENASLRNLWGSRHEQRLQMTREFLRQAGLRLPPIRTLLEQHLELFSSAQTVEAIARAAEVLVALLGSGKLMLTLAAAGNDLLL
jgi:hypothetical protein